MLPRRTASFLAVLALLTACGPSDSPATTGADPTADSGLVGLLTWAAPVPAAPIPDRVPKACGGRPAVETIDLGADSGMAGALLRIPGLAAELPDKVELSAASCVVTPRIAVARTGAALDVRSADDLVHTFHLRRVEPGGEVGVQVLAVAPGRGPLRWTLDQAGMIHARSDHFDWMEAWILVGSDGAWTFSDADGRFSFPDLPAGTWDVEIWHPELGLDRQVVTVPPDGPASLFRTYSGRIG